MADPPSQDPKTPPIPSSASNLPPSALALAERLFNGARSGDSPLLDSALSHNSKIANLTNAKGDSLVMLAAYHGHVDLVRLLLSKYHADANVLNLRGQSPLAGAVFKLEDEVVRVLLEGGADPDLGRPSAEECLGVFNLADRFREDFEAARTRIRREREGNEGRGTSKGET